MQIQASDAFGSSIDRSKFVSFGQGPTIEAPHSLIHEAFSQVAARHPSAVAVEHDGQQISYGELDRTSTNLSRRLVAMGLRPRDRVVLLVQRSIPMIAAIFAVLKSGGQYVPMDGGIASDAAVAHVLSETESPFVLCLSKYLSRAHQFAPVGTQILSLNDLQTSSADLEASDVELGHGVSVSPEDGAYITYTSGSTAKPKGVDVTHRNVTNLLTVAPGNLGIAPGRRVAQILSTSFDMAAWEILGTLMNGGTLCMRTSDWNDTLKRVDTVIATPTILGTLDEEEFPNIKTVALAGEPCPLSLADRWAQGRSFFNCYGLTEATIVNSMHKHQLGQTLSLGRPVPNTTVYILDENAEPLPIGAAGVMWVGGASVSREYVDLPELTNAQYRPDKFLSGEKGMMMFNTGDMCRWREDGTLESLGRIDDQVEVKGFRVGLDGVSAAIESHPEVNKACALLVHGTLSGYYAALAPISDEALKEFSSKTIPHYAVPSKWVWIPRMPLTPNGKIDKKILTALPAALNSAINGSLPSSPSSSTLAPSSLHSVEEITEKSLAKAQTTVDVLSVPSSQASFAEKDFSLPPEKGSQIYVRLRWHFFTAYRRLFSLVFIGNLIGIITVFAYRRTLDNLRLSDLATATAANVTIALLLRQEHVVNLLFAMALAVPLWVPLVIRKYCAKVFHLGGVHASAGVAATFWFIILTIAATIGLAAPDKTSLGNANLAIVLIAYIILILFVSILVTAHPSFRVKHHDIFEMFHRFSGWTILALFWVLTVLSADASRGNDSLSYTIARDPTLYLLAVSTASVILPWLHLRKVPVRSEVLSSHAIRLHFNYTNTFPGTAVRISTRPLTEWHAFATVAKPGVDGFSVIVSNAGDWTKRQIGLAPERLWVRGIPAAGVMTIVPMFRRVVLMATGSGIGPVLPHLLAKKNPMRVFWSTPNPELTFGKEIIDSVHSADPDAVIWNTRTQGKPDMVKEAWKLVVESGKTSDGRFNVEAVLIIANKKATETVVWGMEARGIAAYGAIFDS